MPRILIADDQTDVLAALSLLLKGERFQIESTSSPDGVLRAIETQEFDVVLIDLNYARDTTSGSEGLDLLTRIRAADPTLPVVVMIGLVGAKIWVENGVDFGNPVNLVPMAAAIIIGVGNVSMTGSSRHARTRPVRCGSSWSWCSWSRLV